MADGLITIMGAETDEKFLANVMEQVNDQAAVDAVADTFKMVYTPFHLVGVAGGELGPVLPVHLVAVVLLGVVAGGDVDARDAAVLPDGEIRRTNPMDYKQTYELWLNSPALSAEEKAELSAIAGDEKEIESRFFSQLEFGTAGLRGTMGVGLYRMNIHVIRHATQAFARVILDEGPEAVKKGVAVCFDCRNNSDVFAPPPCHNPPRSRRTRPTGP